MVALLLAMATENNELREQLASTQDMLVETAIDAGNMHTPVEVVLAECVVQRKGQPIVDALHANGMMLNN